MRYTQTIWVIPVLIFAWAVQSRGQIFPELNFPLSAETNAMGGAGVSLISDNALATIANPAEPGLFSLNGTLSVGFVPDLSVSPNYAGLY
ncbi:MAG: hypothetical protein M1469_00035 [Bacteroidetes bacterium]|nr:hypothetical protein [Bacteroidota bacterium]